jgi:hypothetical protein
MSLLPDSASFHERVEALFVAFRGTGVSLSAQDLELVDAWASRNVPFEVVARGVRKAAEAALFDAPEGQGRMRSLRAARKQVEAEIARYLKRATRALEPDGPESTAEEVPFLTARHRKLQATLTRLAREAPGLRPLAEALAATAPPEAFELATRREEWVVAVLLRALPFEERQALAREVERLAPVELSPAARLEARRMHRAAAVRRRYQLRPFW